MKVFRSTIILLVVLILATVYVFVIEIPRTKKKEVEKKKAEKACEFNQENVKEFWIIKQNEKIGFRKVKDREWDIIFPIWAPADYFSLSPILSRYSDLEVERVIEDENILEFFEEYQEIITEYGLQNPKIVEFFIEGYEKPISVYIGGKSPVGYNVYAIDDKGRVVLISAAAEAVIDKKLEEFRKRRPLEYSTQDIKSFEINLGKNFKFENKDGVWYVKYPEVPTYVRADENKVRDILYNITSLEIENFVSDISPPTREIPKKYYIEVNVGETKSVIISPEDGKFYATIPHRPNIYTLKPEKISKLQNIGEIREKKVLNFYVWRVKSISIEEFGKETLYFERDKENIDKWYFKNKNKEIDPTKFRDTLRELTEIEVLDFLKDNVDVLKEIKDIKNRIIISVEGKEKPISLIIGKKVANGFEGGIEEDKTIYLFPQKITEIIQKFEDIAKD